MTGEMVVHREGDSVVVDKADYFILVADELLMNADERWMTFDGDILTVTASNGVWRYRREGLDVPSRSHLFVRESQS